MSLLARSFASMKKTLGQVRPPQSSGLVLEHSAPQRSPPPQHTSGTAPAPAATVGPGCLQQRLRGYPGGGSTTPAAPATMATNVANAGSKVDPARKRGPGSHDPRGVCVCVRRYALGPMSAAQSGSVQCFACTVRACGASHSCIPLMLRLPCVHSLVPLAAGAVRKPRLPVAADVAAAVAAPGFTAMLNQALQSSSAATDMSARGPPVTLPKSPPAPPKPPPKPPPRSNPEPPSVSYAGLSRGAFSSSPPLPCPPPPTCRCSRLCSFETASGNVCTPHFAPLSLTPFACLSARPSSPPCFHRPAASRHEPPPHLQRSCLL